VTTLLKSRFVRSLTVAALCLGSVILAFTFVIRPWYINWGATPAEIARALPGDELVPGAQIVTTRAVTVAAPPAKIWPWLVQVGYQRAGWYNLDWVNGLLGAADFVDGHRSSNRIVPELQDVKVGDLIKYFPGGGFQIAGFEPGRVFGLLAVTDLTSGKSVDFRGALPAKHYRNSMVVVLEPLDAQTTRLIVRERLGFNGKLSPVFSILGPGVALQESRFMLGLKRRAES
jgi:hypothetical protein